MLSIHATDKNRVEVILQQGITIKKFMIIVYFHSSSVIGYLLAPFNKYLWIAFYV